MIIAALFLLDLHILMQRMGNGVMHWFSLDMYILKQLWRADVMHWSPLEMFIRSYAAKISSNIMHLIT